MYQREINQLKKERGIGEQSALDKFKIYKAEVENQLNLKIKVVRSDRGGEYYGRFDETGRNPGPFAKFLEEEGIIAQYTNPEAKPYNPVEKKLDPKTISGYFVGYPERTKGYRFYCPKHTTRFIETSRAVFIETDQERDEEESFSFEEITLNHDMPQISNEDIVRLPQIDSSNTQLVHNEEINTNGLETAEPMELNDDQALPAKNQVMAQASEVENPEPNMELRRSQRQRKPAL
ncbi:hypothetical protein L3X38_003395 [Prunus dulcis]|uniref:Retroviral polymerase SH3-like domain-containing protein n=1 Tax=Prunus dulcis TaxID=3755 RepID=A0AAD4ZLY2_PRUDU|nr:hypothetical protein L3X38_003395 [Prunus dulcis]